MSDIHVLYRMFDRDNVLLYVGLTNNPKGRFRTHSKTQEWWREVANITVQTFDSRKHLAAAEFTAIKDEKPLYNVACNEVPAVVDPTPRCRTCKSSQPDLHPVDEWELVSPDGKASAFCPDSFHFPFDRLGLLLKKRRVLQMSPVAQARLDQMRKAMEPLAELFSEEAMAAYKANRETA